mgnify:CR=1 FL=1
MNLANRLNNIQEYYFSNKLREIDQLKKNGIDVINLGIGNPDFPPAKEVIETLNIESKNPSNHGYQGYKGIEELRNAYAQWYQKYFKVNLLAGEEILPLMGSKEGIMHISMAFLNKGDKVLIPNPGYPTYTSVTRLLEAEPLYYDLAEDNNWLPDFSALSEKDLSDVKPEVRLRDQLDLDSMDFLDIVMELRKQHGIDVPEAEYRELESLDSSANYLLPKFESGAAA